MKNYGIVYSAKSARKHRRAGHIVAKRFGPYRGWAWCASNGFHRYQSRIVADLLAKGHSGPVALQMLIGAGRINGKTATSVVIDEEHIGTSAIGIPNERGELIEFRLGERFHAKRRNAASKPIEVRSFFRKDGQTLISWRQGEKVGADTPHDFLARIGKRVQD